MFTTVLSGFSLGISLILAIGAQNAFVLKQGIQNQHVFWVCLVCALSDALLISAGVVGFGEIVKQFPSIEVISRYAGAAFLVAYAVMSLRSAFGEQHGLVAAGQNGRSLLQTIAMCLAFTWLNPSVYLDTLVLLGSISIQYQPHEGYFALGAIIASFVFFFSLGFGARALAPVLQRPKVWQAIEVTIAGLLLILAAVLVLGS